MANRIKELRKKKGLTLDGLADKSGIKRGTLNNYELGKTEPKLATWERLADVLGVSVGYLQGLDDALPDIFIKVFSSIDEFSKTHSHDQTERYQRLQALEYLSTTLDYTGDYKEFLSDHQIKELLDSINDIYGLWLAYDVRNHPQDSIDDFFLNLSNLTHSLNSAVMNLYILNGDGAKHDITFSDLSDAITPAITALDKLNEKINQQKPI